MAFCNSCGASIEPGNNFCSKCGAPLVAAASAPAAVPPTAVKTGSSSSLKVVLIVVAVILGFGLLGLATVSIVAYRLARGSHVIHDGDHVKVETPFGTAETSSDPEQVAKELGVDIYPGARVEANGASSTTFKGVHTAAANLETSDSVDQVCSFYKSKLPNPMVQTSGQSRCTIISTDSQRNDSQKNDPKNMITINVESSGVGCKFQITNVSRAAEPSN